MSLARARWRGYGGVVPGRAGLCHRSSEATAPARSRGRQSAGVVVEQAASTTTGSVAAASVSAGAFRRGGTCRRVHRCCLLPRRAELRALPSPCHCRGGLRGRVKAFAAALQQPRWRLLPCRRRCRRLGHVHRLCCCHCRRLGRFLRPARLCCLSLGHTLCFFAVSASASLHCSSCVLSSVFSRFSVVFTCFCVSSCFVSRSHSACLLATRFSH